MATRDLRLERAKQAIDSIGLGFDITKDISFDNCKRGPRLIQMNEACRDLKIPGGISIPNVSNSIKCLGGETHRIHSDLLTDCQMSEHFNREMCLTGNVPSGHFCASFGLSGNWTTDFTIATARPLLAYDGWFIRCYAFETERRDRKANDHVKEAVPSTWDPDSLARFIERFGTHVVVGVSMGGKDVFYARMDPEDPLTRLNAWSSRADSFLKFLKDKANLRFSDSAENHSLTPEVLCNNNKHDVVLYHRRGGRSEMVRHGEWLNTVDLEPEVISLVLLPLHILLPQSGFLTHATNLYIKYKPPIEDLYQFLDFQLPRQWAPVPSETSFGSRWKNQVETVLRLGTFGPMLYINTVPVEVGSRPVTGLRLQLEGRRIDRLAIHLEHLCSLPKSFPLSDKESVHLSCDLSRCNFHKKVKRNCYSSVCTAPVESEDTSSIVTGAQLQVKNNCLRLRLRFSKVIGATLHKSPEWDQSSSAGIIDSHDQWHSNNSSIWNKIMNHCRLRCCGLDHKQNEPEPKPKPGEVTVRSSFGHIALPSPVNPRKLGRFVNTSHIVRGPYNSPGYWVVSGAALFIHDGRISLRVKYSLLDFVNKSVALVDAGPIN